MQMDTTLRSIIVTARRALGSERVLILWEEPEEPWLQATVLSGSELQTTKHAPDPELMAFWRSTRRPALLRRLAGGGPNLDRLSKYALIGDMEDAVVVPIRSAAMRGCVVAPGARHRSRARAEFVRERAQRLLQSATQQPSAMVHAMRAEREQIAHDLHDGPLQAITAATLQLRAVEQDSRLPAPLAERVKAVRDLLTFEHRELRVVVDTLLDDWTARPQRGDLLLEETVRRIARAWDIHVNLENSLPATLPDDTAHQICRIVQEGVVNAARHGRARNATVQAIAANNVATITIEDNGTGFPFEGTYTLAELDRLQRGPIVLKRRVSKLGGGMLLHSTRKGARVVILVPLPKGPNAD